MSNVMKAKSSLDVEFGPLEGVLLLDKPNTISSNGALQAVRRLFGRVKAGHTGTLDPLATGLLPICLGEATKFSSGLLESDKTYEAVVGLGMVTTTGDAEGEAIFRGDTAGAIERLPHVLTSFLGEIEQLPPMFSAIKYQGRPLYEYARAGKDIPRETRRVTIEEIAVLAIEGDDVSLRIRCSKGTYIRTLAQDIGEKLGCGGYLKALRRTGIGTLHIGEAVTLDTLAAATPEERAHWLWPTDMLLDKLPLVTVDAVGALAVMQGRCANTADDRLQGNVRLYDPHGEFLGLGSANGNGLVAPKRMRAHRVSVPLAAVASLT